MLYPGYGCSIFILSWFSCEKSTYTYTTWPWCKNDFVPRSWLAAYEAISSFSTVTKNKSSNNHQTSHFEIKSALGNCMWTEHYYFSSWWLTRLTLSEYQSSNFHCLLLLRRRIQLSLFTSKRTLDLTEHITTSSCNMWNTRHFTRIWLSQLEKIPEKLAKEKHTRRRGHIVSRIIHLYSISSSRSTALHLISACSTTILFVVWSGLTIVHILFGYARFSACRRENIVIFASFISFITLYFDFLLYPFVNADQTNNLLYGLSSWLPSLNCPFIHVHLHFFQLYTYTSMYVCPLFCHRMVWPSSPVIPVWIILFFCYTIFSHLFFFSRFTFHFHWLTTNITLPEWI